MNGLSVEMRRCLDFIKANGGKIYKHEGNHWSHYRWDRIGGRSFKSCTVKGLFDRGIIRYNLWNAAGDRPQGACLTKGA